MIDLSKLRTPGWQRVVAELTAPAPDDATFLKRMTACMAQVAGAKQAAWMNVQAGADEDAETAEPRLMHLWPPQGEGAAPERPADANRAARSAAAKHRVEVFGLEKNDLLYDGSSAGYIVAVPVPPGTPREGASVGGRNVVTLLLDGRSQQAMQTTLALVEVLSGYAFAHASQTALRQVRQAGAALDLAAQLLGAINQTPNFKGTCIQFVNDLLRHLQVDRVALGWTKGIGQKGEGERVKVVAMSDTEHIDRRMAMVQKLEAAMDECLDQEQPVMHPAPPERGEEGDALLSHAITHAHRELASSDAKLRVCSLPLRVEEKVVGVVTIETTGGAGVDLGTVELLQATMDLMAPVLRVRRSDDRAVPLRMLDSGLKASGWLVGPKHTVWKLGGLAVMALLLAITFVELPYRVEAPVELQPREKRVVSVPFDGIIREVGEGVEPGGLVKADQILATLDTAELRLSAIEAESQVVQAEKQRDSAMRQRKLGEAQQYQAQADQARARLSLLEWRIEHAEIRAPIAGTIIAGDLKNMVGSAVQLGQPMFEIARMDEMVAVARVSDSDIRLLTERYEGDGLTGELATKAYPAQPFEVRAESIVPLAQPDEGENTFEVKAVLEGTAGWMRPGMEGIARFDTGDRKIIRILSRRIEDQIRLWMWW